MNGILLHDHTRRSIDHFIAKPSHALLLVGPSGTGKGTVARYVAATLLGITAEKLASYPYLSVLAPNDKRSIGIDEVRELQHFVSLKIPSTKSGFTRIAVIENAQLLTHEAQNALLKLIEEPPEATAIILTATSPQALLPTITSRAQTITIHPVSEVDSKNYFNKLGYSDTAIQKAWLVSGGLMGLMSAYLEETEHPLIKATEAAHQLLQNTLYERLLLVDELAKQPAQLQDVLFVLQQMAQLSLRRPAGQAATQKWQRILTNAYSTQEALERGAQTKLALTNLMLTL